MPAIKRILFVLTVLSTFWAGYSARGSLADGALFCGSIMAILLSHEMGHYLMCRYYGVAATLPLFIPMPLSPFGTMGAVIRIRSPIPHRRALFDIGAAGPLAGLAVALPIAAIGVRYSTLVSTADLPKLSMTLGDPLILKCLVQWHFGPLPPNTDVFIHPMAFAAWTGFFVTALNLLPVGQLDGGHVLYAVFGRNSRYIFVSMLGLVPVLWLLSLLQLNYLVILVIVFLVLGFRHPPTIYDFVPLDPKRKLLALFVLVVFVFCFTPYPIHVHTS